MVFAFGEEGEEVFDVGVAHFGILSVLLFDQSDGLLSRQWML